MVSVRVNEQRVIDPAYVEKLEAEVVELRSVISSLEGGNSPNQVDSQLVRLLQENNDLKAQTAKLRRELDARSGPESLASTNNNSNANNNATMEPSDDRTKQLLAQNQHMEGVLSRLKDATDRFFKFEIEEDDLKTILETSFRSLGTNKAAVSGRPPALTTATTSTFARLRTKSAATVLKTAPDVAFRVRGKPSSSENESTWQTDAPPRVSEEDEIKAAEKALKKQAKIQAWLLEKERREMTKLQQQQEYIDEQRRAQAEKDAKFYKRAMETKKKLSSAVPEASTT
ncbi:hypothetical protein SPRG_18435 [Saprolegnia parasitica CBS 223.65]|uniref:Uncharacterized protein n=1 Tax=Saprolegnia parasitica (strain CBS 223.65) TaxID=695850 RepID=A0A067BNV8_SAPPC|nr:hypothetical protein SPRG_18435 [Saprolegnia parasitica CBS 223.65]KDO16026.1 hypothetical protein SPRG_18435 [Saprolegnia parasitica CBS 223.65]|eukprot:XP_012213266.1 hypothetical protein SPRG_18435 [Saprolegnia parasitica CBS 223.65]